MKAFYIRLAVAIAGGYLGYIGMSLVVASHPAEHVSVESPSQSNTLDLDKALKSGGLTLDAETKGALQGSTQQLQPAIEVF